MRNGPVPEGAFAKACQLRPTFSHCVGLAIMKRVSTCGKNAYGYFVVIAMVSSSSFSYWSSIETGARTVGADGASYSGDLSL